MSKLITSTHLLVYVFVKTARPPRANSKGVVQGEPKYEATIVIPKDHPDIERIDAAIAEVYEAEKGGKFKGMPLTSKNFKNPLRDGDEYLEDNPDGPEQYAGCYFLKATSTSQPKLWDATGQEIFDIDEELYSGVYGRCDITFWPFNNESKGITVFLNSIKKTKDGDKLAGGGSASVEAYDEEEDYSAPAKSTRPTRGAATTRPTRGAAPAKPVRPAPKQPVREWAVDAQGNDIWSEDGGANWFYPEDEDIN